MDDRMTRWFDTIDLIKQSDKVWPSFAMGLGINFKRQILGVLRGTSVQFDQILVTKNE